ncbi:MAG: hypothetical protein NVS1B9_14690 [Solirubrobacteraceae bacterium]
MRADRHLLRQLFKYGVVGASNSLVTYIAYLICLNLLGIHYEVASVIGYSVGGLNGYLINRRWTFAAADISHGRAAWRYALIVLMALLVNLCLLHAAVSWLGIEKNLAPAIVLPFVFLATFIPNRTWSFGQPSTV